MNSALGTLYSSPEDSYGFRKCCEAVREAVPLGEVARRYTELEPLGGRAWFTGRCPLPDHEDRDPSFYIYPPSGNRAGERYYCLGCGSSGDVVDLEFHCGDYGELWEAMISLAVEYGVELPKRPDRWRRWQSEKYRRLNKLRDVLAESYRRRYFKMYRDHLVGIEDPDEREQEARAIWRDLQSLSRMCAEYRISQKGSAA